MSPEFKKDGDLIYMIGKPKEEVDGSEFAKVFYGHIGKNCPSINLKVEKRTQKVIRRLIKRKLVKSVDDISLGGLAINLVKNAINGNLGFNIKVKSNLSKEAYLFGETQSRFMVTVRPKKKDKLKKILKKAGLTFKRLGEVTEEETIRIKYNNEKVLLNLDELEKAYRTSFEEAIS